jgi:HSP20 family molecular chaperone IbpA
MEKNEESKDMTRTPARDLGRPEQIRQGPRILPDVDIVEKEEEILLRADLPGVVPDGIDVRCENGVLSLYGRTKRQERPAGDLLIEEFEPMDFYREFTVGEGIDQGKVSAEFENGVLTLHLPKSESLKPRKIEVKKVAPAK